MIKHMEIKKGWYEMRAYPHAGFPQLHWVWVTGVKTLGDGTKVVSYKYNFPLIIKEEMEYSRFVDNVVIKTEK